MAVPTAMVMSSDGPIRLAPGSDEVAGDAPAEAPGTRSASYLEEQGVALAATAAQGRSAEATATTLEL